MRTCEECGGSMDGMRPDAKVCGASCRAKRSRRLRDVQYVPQARCAPRGGSNARSGLQVSYRKAVDAVSAWIMVSDGFQSAELGRVLAEDALRPALSDRQRATLEARDNGR